MRGKILLVCHAIVALGLPLAINCLIPANDGLGAMFLLFAVINPLYSVFLGYLVAKDFKGMWLHLPIFASFFLGSLVVLFEGFDVSFLIYSGLYLGFGFLSYGILAYRKRKKA